MQWSTQADEQQDHGWGEIYSQPDGEQQLRVAGGAVGGCGHTVRDGDNTTGIWKLQNIDIVQL